MAPTAAAAVPVSPVTITAMTLGSVSKAADGDVYDMRTGVLAYSAVVFGLYWQFIG